MFPIRTIGDDASPANQHTLAQVANIMRSPDRGRSHTVRVVRVKGRASGSV